MRAQSVRWKIARRHLNERKSHRLRWLLAFGILLLLLTTGASAAGAVYFASHLPSTNRFHVRYAFQDARFYDVKGDLLYNMADLRKNRGARVVEPLQARGDTGNACTGGTNRIPLLLQNATIATEDATFYSNLGFDPLSIARAAYQDLKDGHIVSGASTITQQVVRLTMLNDERSLTRKAQEVALAYEISRKYSKRKILWYYLNSVPYANLAYGAQAAAEVYFQEPVCRLDMAQAAFLAGLPRAPSLYDPVRHRAAAMARMRTVLGLMRRHGYFYSKYVTQRAMHEASTWRFAPAPVHMKYPQFVQYAVAQVSGMPNLRSKLYQGIDVYTTINPQLQDMAQRTVTKQIDLLATQHVTNGALVSLDLRPQHYGWIMSMVGSAHYSSNAGQFNMAITPRQPGSSIKPFNYIWAFAYGGAGPATTVSDSPIRLPDPNDPQDNGWYQPINYDHLFHGNVTLRQALANSLNVPAVKLEYYITHPNHVASTAARFGMTSLYRDNPGLDCSVCYAVTLGGLTKGTRLTEETAAYGVFATGGWTVPPVAIWKVIKRSTGQVLYCSADCPARVQPDRRLVGLRRHVLDAAHAYEMTNVLSDDSARCGIQVCEFGFNSQLVLSRPAAAKTGTTNLFSDNWTLGYTPQLVTGVWVGNTDRTAMLNVIGVTGAAPIWHDYMEKAFKMLHLPVVGFVQPPNVIRTGQCSRPGSTYPSYGLIDLMVGTTPPLCSLPERGFMPSYCFQPAPTLYQPHPGFQCPTPGPNSTRFGTGYYTRIVNGKTYTYTYPLAPLPVDTPVVPLPQSVPINPSVNNSLPATSQPSGNLPPGVPLSTSVPQPSTPQSNPAGPSLPPATAPPIINPGGNPAPP